MASPTPIGLVKENLVPRDTKGDLSNSRSLNKTCVRAILWLRSRSLVDLLLTPLAVTVQSFSKKNPLVPELPVHMKRGPRGEMNLYRSRFAKIVFKESEELTMNTSSICITGNECNGRGSETAKRTKVSTLGDRCDKLKKIWGIDMLEERNERYHCSNGL